MTIRHDLYFPIEKYSTATSYVSSLTRYCGLVSPRDFCLDLGFKWHEFVKGHDEIYERVAKSVVLALKTFRTGLFDPCSVVVMPFLITHSPKAHCSGSKSACAQCVWLKMNENVAHLDFSGAIFGS